MCIKRITSTLNRTLLKYPIINKIFIIMEKEVFVIFENPNYNFSYLASSGFNSSDLIKSHLNQNHYVDNKKATAKCIDCIVK